MANAASLADADLHPRSTAAAAPKSGPVVADRVNLAADWPTLSTLSRRYIQRALARTGGNKTRAADLLGIDRRTLNRILARDRIKRSNQPKAS